MSPKRKFLFVLSSQSTLPSRGRPTGWYLPELIHPYNKLAAVFDIVVSSPAGGEAPLDPYSIEATKEDPECVAFLKEKSSAWKNTAKLESLLGRGSELAGIFYAGGHGPMFDLAGDERSHALAREFYEAGKVVSAVCHGPAALVNVKLSIGTYLVAGQQITGLSDMEEEILQFSEKMRFLPETELRKRGAIYEKADGPFGINVAISGENSKLVTGQNPPSAAVIGESIIRVPGCKGVTL